MEPSILPTLKLCVSMLSDDPDLALQKLTDVYSADLRYVNPIQATQGREAFFRLLKHMATRWRPFSMSIDEGVESAERVYGRFYLSFCPGFLGRSLNIEGVTRCVVERGVIVEQRDYYDVVSSALDAVPLAGPAFRKIISQFRIH